MMSVCAMKCPHCGGTARKPKPQEFPFALRGWLRPEA